jgi:hypothetical protein
MVEMIVSWHTLGPGVFEGVRLLANGWSLRSVAVSLVGGGTCVVSPTKGLSADGLVEVGAPELFLAANHYHWLGIPEWTARFPGARVVATAIASKRLERLLGAPPASLSVLAERLPPSVSLLEPEGVDSGEVWLEIVDGEARTWIVCDAFFNEAEHPSGFFGFGCRITGTTAGLRLGQTWKYLQLGDRAAYRAWLCDRLTSAPPTRLVMAHGRVIEAPDLGQRLERLVRDRL